MQADNWDRGSLLGFRAISFSEELPAYTSIQQPVLVVQGAQDSTILNTSAAAVRICCTVSGETWCSIHLTSRAWGILLLGEILKCWKDPEVLHPAALNPLQLLHPVRLGCPLRLQIVAQLRQREQALTQYAEFQSCGHIPMEEYPDKFVGVVREFLAAAFGQQRTSSLPPATEPPQLVPVGDTMPAAAVGTSQAEVVRDTSV